MFSVHPPSILHAAWLTAGCFWPELNRGKKGEAHLTNVFFLGPTFTTWSTRKPRAFMGKNGPKLPIMRQKNGKITIFRHHGGFEYKAKFLKSPPVLLDIQPDLTVNVVHGCQSTYLSNLEKKTLCTQPSTSRLLVMRSVCFFWQIVFENGRKNFMSFNLALLWSSSLAWFWLKIFTKFFWACKLWIQ